MECVGFLFFDIFGAAGRLLRFLNARAEKFGASPGTPSDSTTSHKHPKTTNFEKNNFRQRTRSGSNSSDIEDSDDDEDDYSWHNETANYNCGESEQHTFEENGTKKHNKIF